MPYRVVVEKFSAAVYAVWVYDGNGLSERATKETSLLAANRLAEQYRKEYGVTGPIEYATDAMCKDGSINDELGTLKN